MKVILCLYETKGMMFNKRRQSRDRIILERIVRHCEGKRLWMNTYSGKLFAYFQTIEISVDEDFLEKAVEGDYCFVESDSLKACENKIEELIIFWWNKKYPSDFYLDLSFEKWKKTASEEFEGFSHDIITEEIYRRKND